MQQNSQFLLEVFCHDEESVCVFMSLCLAQTSQPSFSPGLKDYSPIQDPPHTTNPNPVFHPHPFPKLPFTLIVPPNDATAPNPTRFLAERQETLINEPVVYITIDIDCFPTCSPVYLHVIEQPVQPTAGCWVEELTVSLSCPFHMTMTHVLLPK